MKPSFTHSQPLSLPSFEPLSITRSGAKSGTSDGSSSPTKSGTRDGGRRGRIESKVVVVPNGIAGIDDCDGINDLNTFAYGRYYPSPILPSSPTPSSNTPTS